MIFFIKKNKIWLNKQLEILKEKYFDTSWDELELLLYPFKKLDIQHKASKLKIKRKSNKYTQNDIMFIKENYNILSYKEIGRILGKTECAIGNKINKLGLKSRSFWSNEEIELLKDIYNKYPTKDLPKYINRTKETIVVMANNLGLKKTNRYTKKYSEEILLKQLIDFSKELNRTPTIYDIDNNDNIAGSMTFHRYFGSYIEALKLADLEIHRSLFGKDFKVYYSKNNDICLSQAELYITNYFIDNNINYKKEVLYKYIIKNDERCNNKRCDWLLDNNVIVEYFGMPSKPYYKIKMDNKIKICKENNIKLIELYRSDLNKLDSIFKN